MKLFTSLLMGLIIGFFIGRASVPDPEETNDVPTAKNAIQPSEISIELNKSAKCVKLEVESVETSENSKHLTIKVKQTLTAPFKTCDTSPIAGALIWFVVSDSAANQLATDQFARPAEVGTTSRHQFYLDLPENFKAPIKIKEKI